MTQHIDITPIFEEILAASRYRRGRLLELVEEKVISVNGRPEQTLYSGFQPVRICHTQHLSRDFDTGTPAPDLIMCLLDEAEELREAQQPSSLLDEGRQRPTKERSSEKQFSDGPKYYQEQPTPYAPEQPRDKPALGSASAQTDSPAAAAPAGWHVTKCPPCTY